MDYGYSPSRECGTMHLPSPTHPHSYRLDGTHFSHLQQLRRSLSRSPSKQSRFQLRNPADSPRSPLSPLALARAFSPKTHKPTSPIATYPESPLATQVVPAKKKFSLRRSQPFRSSPRTRNSNSKSPRRRALGDSTDVANSTTPCMTRQAPGQENTPARRPSADSPDGMDMDRRLGVNDKPIKFEFARRPDLSPAPPAKSSPLKRNDGLMNLSGGNGTSPVAKRRSLHGASNLGNDFESIFDQYPAPRTTMDEPTRVYNDLNTSFSFSSPMNNTQSPRRTTSLRRSTLSQRVSNTPRQKPVYDGEFAVPGAAASKSRNRMSLDSSIGSTSTPAHTPFRKSTFDAGRMGLPQPFRGSIGASQPHPLSYAHTPSSSTSSVNGDTPMAPPRAPAFNGPAYGPPPTPVASNHLFSRSLPIGIGRPHASDSEHSSQDSFDTPFKVVAPPPVAFSTGLLSKKNRNVDEPAAGTGIYIMPDTPSKRQSYPPAAADRTENLDTPLVKRTGSLFGDAARPQHQFGTPSTPFSANVSKFTMEAFGKRPSIFGNVGDSLQRRGSFVSIDGDGDDDAQPESQSPTANRMADSQSSVDDMPPTPTKPNGGSSRRSKESSLRRKTFRHRPSISNDTFAAPEDDSRPTTGNLFGGSSPQTPNEFFAAPDASRLSISGNRRESLPFNSSLGYFPPATPTTPRDGSSFFSSVQGAIPIGLTKNDVDEALSSRFHEIKLLDGGEGEFSQVYRVSKPIKASPGRSPAGSQVWVVKKSKKPYTGAGDRNRKMREVDILYALQGNEHVMGIKAHWEFDSHLYIQTEYCEGGNLRKYLDTVGFNSRLDDFRIWKILLELLMGLKFIHDSGYIHLDLKPANILIDFEGGLKIADFGLASAWPAPRHIDGEGDRHYLAPEALSGRFDKPADVFALGMMLAEIAGNCVIPENGVYWQKLRSGEFDNVLPSLTWSADSSTLSRDSNGDPVSESARPSMDGFLMSDADADSLSSISIKQSSNPEEELARAPNFMVERADPNSMDHVVHAMLNQNPDLRPTAEQVLQCFGCQWVDSRRRAGATVYEGNFGPGDEILATYECEQQYDEIHADDFMDMS
ncbi:kinase-like protein [Cucurbitaria berberidis CBS 394.84]|uniref:Kinase-like protein n=1 Tax=Cucurbitaria berberidis CBS 394.84 TaxID=1168544 RepID=A0A9P4G776_9PLEO|nr:kinase-like protein [Cucurbitaria berberidis CBS 394.84]KAF1840300.1 kinase-like protein [Cucurbitaria berberidis CBS 394.84]